MAANDYYTTHPQNPTTFTHQSTFHGNASNGPANLTATNTSYEPYRRRALSQLPHYQQQQQQYPLAVPTGSSSPPYLSTSLPSDTSSSTSSTDRSLFSSSFGSSGGGEKKSKSERAIKFVEKQVKKQIEKKLNGGKHGGQEQQEQGCEDYGGIGQQDQSGGGAYGFTGNHGGGDGAGKFDWVQDAGGWFGDLDSGGLESVLGG
ncbi:hypothetical protein N0V83_006287 [Neocucurbitaria cava]|uniref:Uncharacterized protein n=1 Tax=Neocucurbitaria cava TaxID=798079 RepID=A0A9W8Y7J2_9PLEO|nr:hypothetical protein N0V83_006287 [Neocucurbitaria cava]